MKMKVPNNERAAQAVVSGGETLGFSTGTTAGGAHLALGWRDERRIHVNPENASVSFEWPSTDYFAVRIGNEPPSIKRK